MFVLDFGISKRYSYACAGRSRAALYRWAAHCAQPCFCMFVAKPRLDNAVLTKKSGRNRMGTMAETPNNDPCHTLIVGPYLDRA